MDTWERTVRRETAVNASDFSTPKSEPDFPAEHVHVSFLAITDIDRKSEYAAGRLRS